MGEGDAPPILSAADAGWGSLVLTLPGICGGASQATTPFPHVRHEDGLPICRDHPEMSLGRDLEAHLRLALMACTLEVCAGTLGRARLAPAGGASRVAKARCVTPAARFFPPPGIPTPFRFLAKAATARDRACRHPAMHCHRPAHGGAGAPPGTWCRHFCFFFAGFTRVRPPSGATFTWKGCLRYSPS